MSYYKEHAKEFIENTIDCDMSDQYRFFEKYLKSSGFILDIGFGSGRDSLYFKNKGHSVYAIDPEDEFVTHGKELGIEHVYKLKAEDMEFCNMFDGIWACASLLHISSKRLNTVFKKCSLALKENGVMYASFKYGDFEGERSDRFYLDLNEKSILPYLNDTELNIAEITVSEDVRPDRFERWLNVILIKGRK